MGTTLDIDGLHALVSRRHHRYRSDADAHRRTAGALVTTRPRSRRRVRHWAAAALHHLAERLEPARSEPVPFEARAVAR